MNSDTPSSVPGKSKIYLITCTLVITILVIITLSHEDSYNNYLNIYYFIPQVRNMYRAYDLLFRLSCVCTSGY